MKNLIKKLDKRIFIISLDGATFDVIKPLVNMGYMPNIKKLMISGSYTNLESTMPPITPTAWTSFMTGKLPEKHGVLDFLQFIPHTGKTSFVNYNSIRSKTVWEILSENNKKVIVINLPMTYPPPRVKGYIVSGFDAPSIKSKFTYPKTLKKEILKIIPNYNFHTASTKNGFLQDEQFYNYLKKRKKSLEQRFLLANHLLEKYYWDVFMVQFQDIDWLQHNLWHYIDFTHIEDINEQRKKTIYSLYSYLDKIIGDLYSKAEHFSPYIIILSDHGFGSAHITVHPNNFLKEWGFLSIKESEKYKKINQNKIKQIKIKKIIKNILNLNKQPDGFINFSSDIIEWKKTRAYIPISDIVAFCYINRIDREPEGIVRFEEVDALCWEIRNKLLSIVDPFSQKNVFSNILIGKDFFKESINTNLPDLILVPNDGFTVNKIFSRNRAFSKPFLTGTHRKNGILIISGEEVKQDFSGFKANIIDLTPTILFMLRLPIPDDLDGYPLLEIFEHIDKKIEWLSINNNSLNVKKNQGKFTTKEEELIEEKLKNLGYL